MAEEADVPAIARLHLASYRAAYRGLLPDDLLAGFDVGERERRWRDSLRNPSHMTIVVEEGEARTANLVAFAEIGPCRDTDVPAGAGELMALHVAETRWRQGIGRMAHGHALEALAVRGFRLATLWVLEENMRARAFYETVGWVPYGRAHCRTVRGVNVSQIRYKLELRE